MTSLQLAHRDDQHQRERERGCTGGEQSVCGDETESMRVFIEETRTRSETLIEHLVEHGQTRLVIRIRDYHITVGIIGTEQFNGCLH